MTVDDVYVEALQTAYRLAYARHIRSLERKSAAKRYDGRGLDLWSVSWGAIFACEQIMQLPSPNPQAPDYEPGSDLLYVSPHALREVAEEDAYENFRDALVADLKRRAAESARAAGTSERTGVVAPAARRSERSAR